MNTEPELAYFHGAPVATGHIRAQNKDFQVVETLSFTPSGDGEHLFLFIEKNGVNTDWVGKQLAKFYQISPRAISWAGMKDRHAVTQQWFGVHLPGRKEVGELPQADEFRVLNSTFNDRKLRLGAIDNNAFTLRVTQLCGDTQALETRLNAIKQHGVPNYFGEQRFGKENSNLKRAERWLFEGGKIRKPERAMAISAVRSDIFNQLVSQRIHANVHRTVMQGDAVMLNGTKSVFNVTADALEDAQARVEKGDCHLSVELIGKGESMATDAAAAWEETAAAPFEKWTTALSEQGVKRARRALRVIPSNMKWEIEEDVLTIRFGLPTGAYATGVLRELVKYENAAG